jgi:hypothetical protein
MNLLIKGLMCGAAFTVLGGCDALTAFKERNDSFTFKGQLPADFGIDAIAFYAAIKPNTDDCQSITLQPDVMVERKYAKRYSADFQSAPHAFSFDIPLNHVKYSCAMKLLRVQLEINGRYGDQKWQRSYGHGAFYLRRTATHETAVFNSEGIFSLKGECVWTFHQSLARSRLDEIEKLLDCRGARSYLALNELNNKTVILTVEASPEETPSERKTWINGPTGWKPCAHQGDWRWCRAPIEFKTFKMNGQTCTVYPDCKE